VPDRRVKERRQQGRSYSTRTRQEGRQWQLRRLGNPHVPSRTTKANGAPAPNRGDSNSATSPVDDAADEIASKLLLAVQCPAPARR